MSSDGPCRSCVSGSPETPPARHGGGGAAGAPLEVVAVVLGRSVRVVRLGLSGAPAGAAWRGAAGGLLAGFTADLVRHARRAGTYSLSRAGRSRSGTGRSRSRTGGRRQE